MGRSVHSFQDVNANCELIVHNNSKGGFSKKGNVCYLKVPAHKGFETNNAETLCRTAFARIPVLPLLLSSNCFLFQMPAMAEL